MASAGGIWVPLAQRVLRQMSTAGVKASKAVRHQITAVARGQVEPATVRTTPSHVYSSCHSSRQPVHPIALRRQAKNGGTRWFSSAAAHAHAASLHGAVRRFFSSGASAAPRYVDRVAFLRTNVGAHAVWKTSGRAPFASTLRPNLTGGTLPRTAGGYGVGVGAGRSGGTRYFSHTPAAPADIVQNVSQAMRAFWVSGKRARFDGTDARTGRTSYKAISALEEETARRLAVPALPKMAPGAFVDFPLNPTITALAPLAVAAATATATATATLGTEGFLDVLSVDFSRALKELSAVMNDLKRLAALGDLPVLLDHGTTLRVRFPGVDADTVDRLCHDLGITRGIVGQDPGFDLAMGTYAALRFPFAPEGDVASEPGLDACALTSPGGSTRSRQSSSLLDDDFLSDDDDLDVHVAHYFDAAVASNNPWLSLPSASSDAFDDTLDVYQDAYVRASPLPSPSLSPPAPLSSGAHMSDGFEGLEGIYRFLEECDRMEGRF